MTVSGLPCRACRTFSQHSRRLAVDSCQRTHGWCVKLSSSCSVLAHGSCSATALWPPGTQDYEAAKARDPEFYRTSDSLQYGQTPAVPEANVDKMVEELNDRWAGLACSHD